MERQERSPFAEAVRLGRSQLGLSQREFAAACKLSRGMIEKIERDRAFAGPITVENLSGPLGMDEAILKELAKTARAYVTPQVSRRDVLRSGLAVVGAAVGANAMRSRGTKPTSAMTRHIRIDAAILDELAPLAITLGENEARKVERICAGILDRYEDNRTESVELRQLRAKARFLMGIVYDERGKIPPPAGRVHLAAAQSAAEGVDWPLYLMARWREAQQWRKEGDVTKDATTSYEARARLEGIVDHAQATPSIATAALFELAKIELERGNASSFDQAIRSAETQARTATIAAVNEEIWPVDWDALIQVQLRDTRIRGLARFGSTVLEVETLLAESRALKRGLTRSTEKVTLPYSHAKVLLRSPNPLDHIRGLEIFFDAYQFAKQDRLKRQVDSGEKVLREPEIRRHLPNEINALCARCRMTTPWVKKNADGQLLYLCRECQKIAWIVPT